MNKSDIDRATPHLHKALEHLLKAWDAIHEVESVVGFEITTDELSDLAGGLDTPDSVPSFVTAADISQWLESIEFNAK